MATISHAVESEFIRAVYLGESILPFRVWRAFEGVIPGPPSGDLLPSTRAADLGFSGLAGWMRAAEGAWDSHKRSRLTLTEQLDFYGKLSSQFPLAALRVVYSKAGAQPAACLLRDPEGVIDHKLYWARPDSEDEGYFLVAILNSEEARGRVEGLQSRGLYGARDFDKVIFTLPIPRFSSTAAPHRNWPTPAALRRSSPRSSRSPRACPSPARGERCARGCAPTACQAGSTPCWRGCSTADAPAPPRQVISMRTPLGSRQKAWAPWPSGNG